MITLREHVHTFSPHCQGTNFSAGAVRLASAASAAFPTTNQAFFMPLFMGAPITIAQLFVWNGATVSGNVDVGVYAEDGTRLVSSGSTAQAGTSVLQVFDVTDTVIGPGNYYLALACDNTTATITRVTVALSVARLHGNLTQASAFPLPTLATFATVAGGFTPIMGFTPRTVI